MQMRSKEAIVYNMEEITTIQVVVETMSGLYGGYIEVIVEIIY
jgi:hypothetical protein